MARRKQEAAPAPADAAEATLMMGEFVAIDREIALEKLAAADAIAWLEDLPFGIGPDFLRTKTELDKQAVIKAIHADAEAEAIELFGPRLTVEQADEFFIDTGLDEDELKKELAAS